MPNVYIHSWVCLSGKVVHFNILVFKSRDLNYNNKIYKGTCYIHKKYMCICDQSSRWRKRCVCCFTRTKVNLQLRKLLCRIGTNVQENEMLIVTSISLKLRRVTKAMKIWQYTEATRFAIQQKTQKLFVSLSASSSIKTLLSVQTSSWCCFL